MTHHDAEQPLESLSERLARLFGRGVDPAISLAPAVEGASTTELVAELLHAGGVSGRYEVRGEIDRGGMGVVLEVWDRELRRPLAMKVALDAQGGVGQRAPDRRRLVRFLEEAQITGQLDHPGIVPVHELGVDAQGRVYFTMRRVRGRDLREVFHCVQFGLDGWTLTRALGVLLRVCETLAFAHSRGVLHRDIKPANVMVGAYGEVYVMDWGLARVIGREQPAPEPSAGAQESVDTLLRDERRRSPDSPLVTSDGDVLGTPAYMPPEQARGEREDLTPRGDVYSLGALLYHLCAHEAPYFPAGGETALVAALDALRRGPPRALAELRPDLAPELVAITERAMAHDPAARYADMGAFGSDLRAWLEGRVVAAHEQGTWAEARKWVQRNRPLAASLAAAVVLAVGGLASTSYVQFRGRAAERVQRERAEAETAKVLRLSDVKLLQELEAEADALWPAYPRRIPALESWVQRAGALVSNLAGHRRTLAEMRRHGRFSRDAEPEGATQAAGPEPSRSWSFDTLEEEWQHGVLAELIEDLEVFESGLAAEDGLTDDHGWSVPRRLAFARELERGFGAGGEYARAWSGALPAIRAAYPGLALQPLMGLVPLGPDPASGLWEFAHLSTGEPARRGPDGELALREETGVVLVLLPGGSFWMGAQADDPAGRNYDPRATLAEAPVREVELSAYLLSKYELTQGQWLRSTGRNPSHYGPHNWDPDWLAGGATASLLQPVEEVTWLDCMAWLPRVGLSLPSEAQWECAARAGSESAWWTGSERESLRERHAANLADRAATRAGSPWENIKDWPELDDGYPVHAPVGSFAANAFGLHEVVGNLWEWCLDGYREELDGRGLGPDPVAPWDQAGLRVVRGGGYDSAFLARSAVRIGITPASADPALGVRPSMGLAD